MEKLYKKEDMLKMSADIENMQCYFQQVSDILSGSQTIKQQTVKYLPKFPKETDDNYRVRIHNSKFTNIFRDVVDGLACKPFQKKLQLSSNKTKNGVTHVPEEFEKFIDNVDGCGNNLTTFAGLTFFNAVAYGIDWIFVDYPNTGDKPVSRAESKNIKPYWTHVMAKNVLAVESVFNGSKEVISYFKYLESEDKVRVYELTLEGVLWGVYSKDEKDIFNLVDNGVMKKTYIPVLPFVTGRRSGMSYELLPPMQDAADLQIELYRDESALQYIKMLACYPMLTTTAIPSKDVKGNVEIIETGPNKVLYGGKTTDGSAGEWRYLEPQANCLEFLKKDISSTKMDIRELGRQPLTSLSSQLTTVTTAVAAGKATSAVSAWCYGLQDTLENLLIMTAEWMGVENQYDPYVVPFTPSDSVLEDGSVLSELNNARTRGDLSLETYWEELKAQRVLSADFTAKRERERLLTDVPSETINYDFNKTEEKENGKLEN